MGDRRRVSIKEFGEQTEAAGRRWYIWQAIGTRRFGIMFCWAKRDGS